MSRRSLTVLVQIQFDQYGDEEPLDYVLDVLGQINDEIQNRFDDISPIIFASSVDHDDIYIEEAEDE